MLRGGRKALKHDSPGPENASFLKKDDPCFAT